jgi:hypothetical protein
MLTVLITLKVSISFIVTLYNSNVHILTGSCSPQQVLRQTTLPSVPTRHQTFQRQLSHRLDLPNIQFSVCSLEHRADSSIGLIKVRNNILCEVAASNSRTGAIRKHTTPNKRVWNLPTSIQLRATWHIDSLDMLTLWRRATYIWAVPHR